jgi:phosphoglycerate dehydrogenase-like enzyme
MARLQGVSPRLKFTTLKARKAEEIPAEIWANTEVLYTNRVLPTLEQAPKLRWVQFHWAGIDHVASNPLLHQPEVRITNMSGAAASQVAEYILMMLLGLGHRLIELSISQRRGEWPKERWERFTPRELRGATVGIVGYGSIGRQTARLLQPFGATVLATKRDVMHPADTGYTPEGLGDPEGDFVHRLYPPEALKSMARACDFLVVTAPLTSETRGLVSAEVLAALKPSAYVIDVSRGGVIDPEALLVALRDHRIAGAALDVFPEEPLPENSPLWKLNNVILTPHISGTTPVYDQRAVDLFSENLHRYLAGLTLYNLYDPRAGY